MGEYVDRYALNDELAKLVPYAIADSVSAAYTEGLNDAHNVLLDFPAADVAPVVHAEWRKDNDAIVCSLCGFGMFPIFVWSKNGKHSRDTFYPRFCPDCGARMDV